ncbi:MAG: phage tail spike protein [Peptostreptococcus sp.]|uniref:phage tail spike protein n=2 Tax=Bacillota TaxID=1239 RepID=UPI00290B214C|nr:MULTISPECIES: phage tail spike protein [Bacillota]MDU3434277.1 phage tail spike protein [Veillonella sp.]MDU3454525.1 phage tail spike protein [Peptostreptococcus sp.]MDU5681719.1 phage tail spike protein [Peptostreptococcus sp.]MDU5738714.1 phage tail spike protein [Peptostreptococcus sp.]
MYKIFCDNNLIFDLSNDMSLTSPILKLQDNNAGTLEFGILPGDDIYDKIKKMKSEILVYSENRPIFSCRSIDENIDFKNIKKITCEGALAYLNDSVQRPHEYHDLSIRGYLETLITNHNLQVSDPRLQFEVGIVTVHDDNDSIYKYTNWESTLQVIKTDLVDKYGGHLRVRIEGDKKYLDYLKDYPKTNAQVIEFGANLLDFTKNIDATQIVTAVIPLGARLEESSIPKLEERLTIKSVNNGVDYVASPSAIDTYGWIFKTVTWDNVHKPLILKHKGEEYLKSIQFENVVIKVRAIDLHMVDVNIEQIELLDQVRVISKPNGLDKIFPVSELTIDMTNPQANSITLGNNSIQAMSGSAVSSNTEILKKIEDIPDPTKAMQEAVENVTKLLNNALNGHVVKRKDELLIMDTADIETATKVWRWNLNGLAYSNTGYKGPYELAMTMDGSIVANRITTGVLKGGYVKLDLERGTFLIGKDDNDFLLKFDGEKLQFGNGTLSKDSLEKELLDALKGKDGESFKFNLISNGDFHYNFTKDEPSDTSQKLNEWQVAAAERMKRVYILPAGEKWIMAVKASDSAVEVNQYIDLKDNTKYYVKFKATSNNMSLYYYGDNYVHLAKVTELDRDNPKVYSAEFTTHKVYPHKIQFDCRQFSEIHWIILSESPIPDDIDWYPSKQDSIGKQGPPGRDGKQGPPGKDGSMADLPPALKAWNGRATEISGKYVFTPELFVGNGLYENKTGIYIGENIRAKFHDRWQDVSGMVGMENGQVNWMFTNTGNLVIGSKIDECIQLGADGRAIIPMIKTNMIEAGAITADKIRSGEITTDFLYPGTSERIILERGYSPGANDCKSIDANGDAIRLKVNAGTYIAMKDSGSIGMYSGGSQFFSFNPNQGWDWGSAGGDGVLNLYDAHVITGWLEYYVYSVRSDRRVKDNIKYIKNNDSSINRNNIFNFVKSVDLATYQYKKIGGNNLSMIAQDVQRFRFIQDYLVVKDSEGLLSINMGNYHSMVHIALQEEIKKREALEDKVGKLEQELANIKKLLKERGIINVKEPESN